VPLASRERGLQVSRPRLDLGVSDGTRTRDSLDHNQGLYQLSYTHHSTPALKLPAPSCSVLHRPDGRLDLGRAVEAPYGQAGGVGVRCETAPWCRAAISFAVALSRPGWGTKTASR
jgi:hypothetical protein